MEITKKEWNERVRIQEHTEFLQSYEWGEFQRALGRTVIRIYNPQFLFSAIRSELPLGFSYLYIPRGPLLTRENISAWHTTVKDMMQTSRAVFLRLEPVLVGTEQEKNNLLQEFEKNMGKERVIETRSIQPKDTWIIDLSKNTDRLLAEMHSKTRYNIRLAERRKVSVTCTYAKQDIARACDIFLKLARKTSHRQEFRLHPEKYYKVMSKALEGDTKFFVYIAQVGGKDIAAALVIRFGDTATYLHGGSDERYKDSMAPHALQWKIMQDMKENGARWYDMGGVDLGGDLYHPWAGITRFKQGFGGGDRHYVGTYDLISCKGIYTLYEWLRKKCLRSSMDRTRASEARNAGSIPAGGTRLEIASLR